MVASFYLTVIALTDTGRVYAWGYGYYGSCGLGHNQNVQKPTLVKALEEERIVMVSTGEGFTACVTEDGRLFTMGDSSYGQHGDGNTSPARHKPVQVTGVLADKKVVRVGTGGYHIIAQCDDGDVYAWGYNYYKQLGLANASSNSVLRPTKSEILSDHEVEWAQWACGYFHSMALDAQGNLYTWGTYNNSTYPVCGHGDTGPTAVPKRVEFFDGQVVNNISAGLYNSFATTNQGHAYAWGRNQHYACGLGDSGATTGVKLPFRCVGLEDERVLRIHGGNNHSACVCESGAVYTWGYGTSFQLGLPNDTAHKKAPTRV
eukprot:jgi/Bigna1/41899/e_gw1.57.68.1